VKENDNLDDLDVDGSLLNRESSYVTSRHWASCFRVMNHKL